MHKTNIIVIAGISIGIFLFLRFALDPRLIYHVQEPPFLCDFHFFSTFSRYPGGLVWYASALLTQFHLFPWAGAGIITLVLFVNYWFGTLFLRNMGIDNHREVLCALPVLFQFGAYCSHLIPLSYALSLSITLLFSYLYTCRSIDNSYFRIGFFGFLAVAAYYLTGTGALVFGVLCGLYDALMRKKYVNTVVIVVITALLPVFAAKYIFIISISSAYHDYIGLKTNLLDAAQYPRTPPLIYGAYLFFPLLIIARYFILLLLRKWKPKKVPLTKKMFDKIHVCLTCKPLGAGLMVVAFLVTSWCCFDGKEKANYRIDYYARHRFWDAIVREITPANQTRYSLLSHMHLFRALYYRHLLLSELFIFPGALPGRSFLMTTGQMVKFFPIQMSDCYFEIGGLNQAKYWAHEALALKGKKPWLLQRLAYINLLQGNKRSAKKFIVLLDKTLFHRKWALTCRRFLESDSLFTGNEYLKRIKSYAPNSEYLCRDFYSELVHLFEASSDNRIAFEFIVAENLLNNCVSPVVDNTGFFKRFGYTRLPRHIEEAVVFQRAMSNSTVTTSGGFHLRSDCFKRFERFNRILMQFPDNRKHALDIAASEYNRTYWYYLAASDKPVMLQENQ